MRSEKEDEEIRADRTDERLVRGLEEEYRMDRLDKTVCLLCSKTYEEHLDKPHPYLQPRVGCLGLKANFILKDDV